MRTHRARIHGIIFVVLCSLASSTIAAESTQEAEPGTEQLAQLEDAFAQIDAVQPLVTQLEEAYAAAPADDVLTRTVIDARLDRAWNSLVSEIHRAAGLVQTGEANGVDLAEARARVETLLAFVPTETFQLLDRLSGEVSLPTRDQAAAEQSAIFAQASIAIDRVDALYDQLLENLALQEQFSLDVSGATAELRSRLEGRAAGTSAFLDVSSRDVEALSTQSAVLPDDAEVAARLAVARQRVALSADVLRSVIEQMQSQELDTKAYEAQLITRTGEITTDVLDLSVLADLARAAWDSVADWFAENGASLIFSLLIFLVIVYATFKVAAIAQRLLTMALDRGNVQLSSAPEAHDRLHHTGCDHRARYPDRAFAAGDLAGAAPGRSGYCRLRDRFCSAGYAVQFCLRHDDPVLQAVRRG